MKRITGINFLRFIAALGIIVFHFGCHNPIASFLRPVSPITNIYQGDLWVTLFLMISGMCLARKYGELESFDLKAFFINRWKSIFPLFFLIYICVFAYTAIRTDTFWWNSTASKWSILLSFLGIDGYVQCLFNIPTYFLVGEWFLGAIIILYILFPFFLVLVKKIPIISLLFFTLLASWLPYKGNPSVVYLHVCMISLSFFIGMCLERIEHLLNNKFVVIVSWINVLTILFIPMPWMAKMLYPGVIYRIVFFFVALKSLGAWIEHFNISNKVISKLATLSYPMFLLQHVVIFNVLGFIGEPQTMWMAALLLLLDIVLTIALAWGFTLLLSAIQTQIQKRISSCKSIN